MGVEALIAVPATTRVMIAPSVRPRHRGAIFLISRPIDERAATAGNGSTIGFDVESPEQADAWHEAGTAHGGTAIEHPPGERNGPAGRLYLAYLRDPDGNKLYALHRLG